MRERWRELNWPRDYDKLVWGPVKALEKRGGEDAIHRALAIRRHYAKHDAWFFSYFVMGRRAIGCPLYHEYCEILSAKDPFRKPGKDLVTLLPRFHLKSSVNTVDDSIRYICMYPQIRIVLVSGKYDEAVNQYQKIRLALEENEILKLWFPEIFFNNPGKESPRWMENALKVRQPDARYFQAEPTICALSLEGLLSGPHYDMVKFDDMVNKFNSGTRTAIDRAKELAKGIYFNLEPGRPAWVTGTIYAHTDWHHDLLTDWRRAKEQGRDLRYEVYIRKERYRENDDLPIPAGAKAGDWILPIKMNQERWDQLCERVKDPKLISAQMRMEPMAPGEAKFDVNDLRYYKNARDNGEGKYTLGLYEKTPSVTEAKYRVETWPLNLYMTIDCAASEKAGSDFSVAKVTGVNPLDDWVIREYVRGHYNSLTMLDKIVELLGKHPDILDIGLEMENIGKTLYPFLLKRLDEEGIRVKVTPIPQPSHRGGDKMGRIEQELGWRLSRHKIYVQEGMYELEDEIIRFGGSGGTLDLLDALSNVAYVREIPKIPINETEHQRKVRELIAYYKGELPGQVQPAEESPLEYGRDTIAEELLFA